MRAYFSIAALALALWPSRAHADDDVKKHEATERFQEGLKLADAKRDDEARVKFAQSYLLGGSPNALFNLARMEQNSGHTLDALLHWKEYVGLPPSPKIAPPDVALAKSSIAELSKQVGHIAIEVRAGERILLDGLAAGVTPLVEPLDVTPGKHSVEAVHQRVDVDARAGEVAVARFSVDPEPPPVVPPSVVPLPPPPQTPLEASPTTFWTTRNALGLVLGGVAVVGGAVGVGFALKSNSASSDASRLSTTIPAGAQCTGAAVCGEIAQDRSTQTSDKNAATGFFVGAGVLALASAATFVFWPTSSSTSHVGFTPILLPGGAGGRWTF